MKAQKNINRVNVNNKSINYPSIFLADGNSKVNTTDKGSNLGGELTPGKAPALDRKISKSGNHTTVRLSPLRVHNSTVGEVRYLPAASKEWKNSVYTYNSNTPKNYPVYDLNIDSLIKGYFNMYFKNKFLQHKFVSRKKKLLSLNKIFVSKAEVKHTNSKAIITIYVYNREQIVLNQNLQKYLAIFRKLVLFLIKLQLSMVSRYNSASLNQDTNLYKSMFLSSKSYLKKFFENIFRAERTELLNPKNFKEVETTEIQNSLSKLDLLLKNIRRYKLKLNLNRYKMENQFLSKLGNYISQYYGKQVEFNIVSLKSITHNTDIFTQILTSKIKVERSSPLVSMSLLLKKLKMPEENSTADRIRVHNTINPNLIKNRFKNINISSILANNINPFRSSHTNPSQGDDLNGLLMDIHNSAILGNDYSQSENETLRNMIMDKIQFKLTRGARIRVKGRLTKRYKAERATYKIKLKGGLKNLNTAFKGLPGVIYRGHSEPNVDKSMLASKRRIGSFAVVGWIGTK